MAKKTAGLSREGIEKLPDNKPVVYKIFLTEDGRNNYTGIAQRGRVRERLQEHLPVAGTPFPEPRRRSSRCPISMAAREKEARIIARSNPPYNERGR